MRLSDLIDLLHKVELRHPSEFIEVEIVDESGARSGEFTVHTEYIIAPNRKTVLLKCVGTLIQEQTE